MPQIGKDNGNALSKTHASDGITLGDDWQPEQIGFRYVRTDQSRVGFNLVGSLHVFIEHPPGNLNESRVGHPSTIVTGQNLTSLILLDFSHLGGIRCWVVLDGNCRRHPSHGERTALVTDVDEALHVGLHQGRGHGKVRPIGGDLVVMLLEFLDVAEEIVPATAVETKGVVLELVENLNKCVERIEEVHTLWRVNRRIFVDIIMCA